MVTTSRALARYMIVGATPRKLHSWACTTFSARPTATPASMAFPPCRRMSRPIIAALGWLATTTPLVPWINGRKLVNVVPAMAMLISFGRPGRLSLLDGAEPPGVRSHRAYKRPVFFKSHCFSTTPFDQVIGPIVDGVVKHAGQELHRDVITPAFLPCFSHLDRTHGDIFQAVDVTLGTHAIAVLLHSFIHFGREQLTYRGHIASHPGSLHSEEEVRSRIAEPPRIEAGVHLANVPQPALQITCGLCAIHSCGRP